MKCINERHELAMAMNFGKYPVLSIDLADSDDYGLKGCKVRIDAGTFKDGTPYIITADLRVYRDECKLTTSADPCGLHADFTYSDYTGMVANAQAPLIKADQDVVIPYMTAGPSGPTQPSSPTQNPLSADIAPLPSALRIRT